jgi:POT family proton-dependent oligopeptide transporter
MKKAGLKSFSFTFWIVVLFEFFERGAYYGMMSVFSVYMINDLGFSKSDVGWIKGTIQPLLYFLPILSGAIADKMGYRRTIFVAFSLLGLGYFLTSQSTQYFAVFASLVVMGIGAGTFKPVISGTIAKLTNEENSSLGFGIYYWSINLGAFIFPMFIVPFLKKIDGSYVMIASAISTAGMLIPAYFFFKNPALENKQKDLSLLITLKDIFNKIRIVFLDWRFILFIFIYSWFWILYFQMYDSVLWYLSDFVDAESINNFVRHYLGFALGNDWKFDVEHVTVINALTIIVLQLGVSSLVKNLKALPTIVAGVAFGTLGMAILAISSNIWIFMAGISIFTIGEMVAHPKFISYLGTIAPEDKKATYMGFGFLYGVFGSGIGGILGAKLYLIFVDNPMIEYIKLKIAQINPQLVIDNSIKIKDALKLAKEYGINRAEISAVANTTELWLIFASIGVFCIIGLIIYQKYLHK